MGSRIYPTLHCTECGELVRMVAACENPEAQTETRFYECTNPACRDSFKARVPIIPAKEWIGISEALASQPENEN